MLMLFVISLILQNIRYVFIAISKADHLINSLEYERSQGFSSSFDAGRYVEIHAMLLRAIPNPEQIINFTNSKQGTDGLFDGGKHSHYSAHLAIILTAYNILNSTPTKSLDTWFQTIDTWSKVLADSSSWEDSRNPWGGVWGYAMSWIIYYHQEPPWINEFINYTNVHPETWVNDNHQRAHVYSILFTLQKPLPFLDDVITNTLKDQNTDGSWTTPAYTSPINEAMQAVHLLLALIDGNFAPSRNSEMQSAITKAKPWIDSCYKEPSPGYGVFTSAPNGNFDSESTWSGAIAAVDVGLMFGYTDPLGKGIK